MSDSSKGPTSNNDHSKAAGVANVAKPWKRSLVLALCLSGGAFLLGGLTNRHELFPWPEISNAKDAIFPKEAPASRYTFDSLGRLIADESKTRAECPAQTRRTAVLLLLGQSNAANHGGNRYRSKHGGNIVNFFNGECYFAQSPLLGATGTKGEYWTQLANLLVDANKFDQVVLAPLAINGSPVSRWAQGGDLNKQLTDVLSQLKNRGYKVTSVLWHQGEADYIEGTSQDAYRARLTSMLDTLRQKDVQAKFFVSIASKCLEPSNGGTETHSPDNAIIRAQLQLADDKDGDAILRGVNTDVLLDEVDRYDDCHIGGAGASKVATAWAKLLLADRSLEAENR